MLPRSFEANKAGVNNSVPKSPSLSLNPIPTLFNLDMIGDVLKRIAKTFEETGRVAYLDVTGMIYATQMKSLMLSNPRNREFQLNTIVWFHHKLVLAYHDS